jgi:Rrf2 family protein
MTHVRRGSDEVLCQATDTRDWKRDNEGEMRLSQTAEYALRTMAQLAIGDPHTPVTGKELARQTDIPSHYLSKLLRKLVVAGLLSSQKGHSGGFRLARPAAEIRLLDILNAVEAGPDLERCSFGWGKCDAAQPCPLHPVFVQLNEAIDMWASRRTLADLRASWHGHNVRGSGPSRPSAK